MKALNTLLAGLLATLSLAHAENVGGVGSGGGGTLPAETVSPSEITMIVAESRPLLRLAFNRLETYYYSDPAAFQKLYGGPVTIHELVKTHGIWIEDENPCLDANGDAKDASIYSSNPGHICLSSFTITAKLAQSEGFRQIFALLAHEYGHLAGLDEAQAVNLQKHLVAALEYMQVDETTAMHTHWSILTDGNPFPSIANQLHLMQEGWANLDVDQRSDLLQTLVHDISQVDTYLYNQAIFSLLPAKAALVDRAFGARFRTVLWKAIGATSASDASYWNDAYENVFQSDETIDYVTWAQRNLGFSTDMVNPPGFFMQRIHTDADFIAELGRLETEAKALGAAADDTFMIQP